MSSAASLITEAGAVLIKSSGTPAWHEKCPWIAVNRDLLWKPTSASSPRRGSARNQNRSKYEKSSIDRAGNADIRFCGRPDCVRPDCTSSSPSS